MLNVIATRRQRQDVEHSEPSHRDLKSTFYQAFHTFRVSYLKTTCPLSTAEDATRQCSLKVAVKRLSWRTLTPAAAFEQNRMCRCVVYGRELKIVPYLQPLLGKILILRYIEV